MQAIVSHFRNLDWILIGSSFGLLTLGLVTLYSASMARGDFGNFEKQILFAAVGVGLMFVFSFFDYRLIRNNPHFILALYVIGILAFIGLLAGLAPEIRGTTRWYRVAGISIDPIEFMKLVMVMLMAKYLALRYIEAYQLRHILITGAYFALPAVLVALQPNLAPAFVFFLLWSIMLLVARVRLRYLLSVLLVGALIFAIGWTFFFLDYQKNRIISFLEPELDPLGMGWSQLQAKIAIGNGGLFGQGFLQGTQTQYGFLSEPHTDFIFSALAEEWGLAGVVVLFALYVLLVWRVFKIGLEAQTNFARLFAVGFAIILIVPTFINVGMNLGVFPIMGLALPLLSYGGATLVFTFIGLGFLLSIKTH